MSWSFIEEYSVYEDKSVLFVFKDKTNREVLTDLLIIWVSLEGKKKKVLLLLQ